ncbi:MAG: P-loop NTPase [Clostridia bacterium]|nr:P-loop NTPase [Clostridia bacterium]
MLDKIKNRICVLCGHYGSGKTNVAVNLAKAAARAGKRVCIVDFDVVNPYFRTADNRAELTELGVRCIIPQYANTNVDIPSIPAEFQSVFISDEFCIIDVGGDDGAIALSAYKERFEECGYDMVYVYNKSRPLISEEDDAAESVRYIEATSGMRISWLVNNTNLGEETTARTVEEGEDACLALSERVGVPFLATTAFKEVKGITREGVFYMDNATKRLF